VTGHAGSQGRWPPRLPFPGNGRLGGRRNGSANLCRCKGRWRRVRVIAWLAGDWSSPRLPKGAGSVWAVRSGVRRGQGPGLLLRLRAGPLSYQWTGGGRPGDARAPDNGERTAGPLHARTAARDSRRSWHVRPRAARRGLVKVRVALGTRASGPGHQGGGSPRRGTRPARWPA
jgi:hypothetical protein